MHFKNKDDLELIITAGSLVVDRHGVYFRAKMFEVDGEFIVGLDKAFDNGEFILYSLNEVDYPVTLIDYNVRGITD